ncbi:MAG: hypothetical protein GTN70_06360 [Deltaproteobacteria bacterium]|nr:hypothetical protein [Deltaproteobacteria bacterium]NIS77304.1 hypothetical protein [Deltaproteobacteria bacterium]
MKRLVILSGPSCVGKTPLFIALSTFYPHLAGRLVKVVPYNSRDPRPGEQDGVDYHFRPREVIEDLFGTPGYICADVRGDLHAVEIESIKKILSRGKDAFFEGNPYVAAGLIASEQLQAIPTLKVFLSPLSKDEIQDLKNPANRPGLEKTVTDMMRRKLLRRTGTQKTRLSPGDRENIETRAGSAFTELREGWKYDFVIPNHDGEDSEHWDAFHHPIGDARRALVAFAALLTGGTSYPAERWEKDLVP